MKPRTIVELKKPVRDVYPPLFVSIGMKPHILIEWVAFNISASENLSIKVAANHYFTIYILSKYMSHEAVSEILSIHYDAVQESIDISLYAMRIDPSKNIMVFGIIARINNEITIKKLTA